MVPDPLKYFKTVVTPEKLRLSLAYLQRATVWSDLAILVRTFIALLASSGSADSQSCFAGPPQSARHSDSMQRIQHHSVIESTEMMDAID
jgi:hypothetical protein